MPVPWKMIVFAAKHWGGPKETNRMDEKININGVEYMPVSVAQEMPNLPQTEQQAEWMQKVGYRWIADNAPHRLTDAARELAAARVAIRGLSQALDRAINTMADQGIAESYWRSHENTLTAHADEIRKSGG